MSFVPKVFKKNLDQFFTPLSLIETIVHMMKIGPVDKVCDPAMGTADFLTVAMNIRKKQGDDNIIQRLYGADKDSWAYQLSVVNMILNQDGQSNLVQMDSIEHHGKWSEEIDVALCNPPFGSRTVEKRTSVLQNYELGYEWEYDENSNRWTKTARIRKSQQLGLLFIERCYKLLINGGRMEIILPEGYLCTGSYGYVREWIISNMKILSLVELPRRIFLKSEADLRANILIAQRLKSDHLKRYIEEDYPIHAQLVRRVGYKLGKGFPKITAREPETGEELRTPTNDVLLDTDFARVRQTYDSFTDSIIGDTWKGARFHDIKAHQNLDMKPRRMMIPALENRRQLLLSSHVRLGDIADVVEAYDDLSEESSSMLIRLVKGQDIRAVEGTVVPQEPDRAWRIIEGNGKNFYHMKDRGIVVGLVRTERRNIGLYLDNSSNVYAAPQGVGIVRPHDTEDYPLEWVFSVLRSEYCRLQFWTESGGTSYGKLTRDHIRNVILPVHSLEERQAICKRLREWCNSVRKAILNSPGFGLIPQPDDFLYEE